MSRILSWLVSLVAKFCSKGKTLWSVFSNWLGKGFAKETFGAASGAEAGTALAAAAAAKSAALGKTAIKSTWFKDLLTKLTNLGLKRKLMPSVFSVNGMLLGLTAYQIFKDHNKGGSATTSASININNCFDHQFDKFDKYYNTENQKDLASSKSGSGSDPLSANSSSNVGPHDSAFATLDDLDRIKAFEALNSDGDQHFFIHGQEVTLEEFSDFVTATRVYKRHAVPMSDSTVDKWLIMAFDPDDNDEYLYEDGLFMDKAVADLVSQGTYLRTKFDHVVAPVMRQLGVGTMAELKPLMRLVQMDPDEFTAIERTLQIWR